MTMSDEHKTATEADIKPEKTELQTCQEKLAHIEERFAYLSADFENFRRNTSKERAVWMRTAQSKIFEDLVTIVDDFDRAMADLHKAQDLTDAERARFQGIDLIHKMFFKLLEKHDVTEIATDGQFDPAKHEALMQVDDSAKESGEIVQVLQKGYTHQGVVIRPAKVSVAK